MTLLGLSTADPRHWLLLCIFALAVIGQAVAIYLIHRRSEKRDELFRIITENAADMIALVDLKGRRQYNSPSYKRTLGYSPAELSATSAFEQIHPDDRFKVLEAARSARETGVGKRLEYRLRHKNGSWRILESTVVTARSRQREHEEQRSNHNTLTEHAIPSVIAPVDCPLRAPRAPPSRRTDRRIIAGVGPH